MSISMSIPYSIEVPYQVSREVMLESIASTSPTSDTGASINQMHSITGSPIEPRRHHHNHNPSSLGHVAVYLFDQELSPTASELKNRRDRSPIIDCLVADGDVDFSPKRYGSPNNRIQYHQSLSATTSSTTTMSPTQNGKLKRDTYGPCSPNRPVTASRSIVTETASRRYLKEDHWLKSSLRKDFYCATVWFPFFLHAYYPDFNRWQKWWFSFSVYSFFLFTAVTCNLFTILVGWELMNYFTQGTHCESNRVNPAVTVLATSLYIFSLLSEYRLSMEPLFFWWRIVGDGDWEFILQPNGDSTVELIKVTAPRWNCYLRFIIVGVVQTVSNLILLIVGLLTIQYATSYFELVGGCLSFIWLSQIDEYLYQYLFLYDNNFRSLWRDTIFEETVFIYYDKNYHPKQPNQFINLIKIFFTSVYGVALIATGFMYLSKYILEQLYCKKGGTPLPPLEPPAA